MKKVLLTFIAVAAFGVAQSVSGADQEAVRTIPPDCDRACLYGVVDQYLDGLVHRDPARVPWTRRARYTENNVEMPPGEGMWGTVVGLGSYQLKFADTRTGQVGFFGVLEEPDSKSGFALRLKVEDHRISEAEAVVVRIADFPPLTGGANPFAKATFEDKPILQQNLAPGEGRARERLISIANGYFDTLQLNDGALFTQFDPKCDRIENGIRTTNNPAKPLGELSALGCEAQFKLGAYRYDDQLRARRFPLVDEERGLVLGLAFIDHSGRLGRFTLTDGRTLESPIRRPHSFCLMEVFKIVDGRIRQIEAVFMTVPYKMPSPWTE